MNKFNGIVKKVQVHGSFNIITVALSDNIDITAIIISSEKKAKYLDKSSITVLFNETEVILAKGLNLGVTIKNQFQGELIKLERDQPISRAVVKTAIGEVTALITTDSIEQVDLQIGDTVIALIKTNEVMLEG